MTVSRCETCRPSDDPRYKRSCQKCGRVIGTEVPRDIAQENAYTKAAGEVVGLGPTAEVLAAFALRRAGTGPVHDLDQRDMAQDMREEIADCRNYGEWWRLFVALYRPDAPGEFFDHLGRAHSHMVAMWHEVDLAEKALGG